MGAGVPKVGRPARNPLLQDAYLQGGCVPRAGLGQPLVGVVKQGLQMGRCVYSGCGDLPFTTNDIWGNVCPARYFSINYPDFSPRFTLSWRSPPSRPQCTAHVPYKAQHINGNIHLVNKAWIVSP